MAENVSLVFYVKDGQGIACFDEFDVTSGTKVLHVIKSFRKNNNVGAQTIFLYRFIDDEERKKVDRGEDNKTCADIEKEDRKLRSDDTFTANTNILFVLTPIGMS